MPMSRSVKRRRHVTSEGMRTYHVRILLISAFVVLTVVLSSHQVEVVGLSMRSSSSKTPKSTSSSPARRPLPEDTTQDHSSAPPKHKIEFVNFWGSKIRKDDGDETSSSSSDNINPRHIPCVETLDLHDGPLPPGAYLQKGKPEFEAKLTCRIGLNVQLHNSNSNNKNGGYKIDTDEMVQRLQSCIDAGFSTFQLPRQTRQGLELIKKLKQETPSYVETHWSLRHQVPTSFSSGNPQQQQLGTRQSILKLVEQTGGQALDSLQLVYNPNSPYTLDVLDHLSELQREGLIRSIGVKDMPPRLMGQATKAGLHHIIDFQQQFGNLLLPSSSEECDTKLNLWIENVLASSLLTASIKDPLQMTRDQEAILNEWATRREAMENENDDNEEEEEDTTFSTRLLWDLYQDQVEETLRWIALKHRVSPTSVAIRWALEHGSDSIVQDENNDEDDDTLPPIVSSAIIDCPLDVETFDGLPVEWRKVFRFELDEEDTEMLQECSAPTLKAIHRKEKLRKAKSSSPTEDADANPDDALNDWERELLEYQRALEESDESLADEEYPEIDFSNKALWL